MNGTMRWLVAACLASALAGCSTVVVEPAAGTHGSASATASRTRAHDGSYRVVKGDTLYSIAFRNGLDFRDLARWNGIDAPYTIWPGQVLRLTPGHAQVAAAPHASPSRATTAPQAAAPVPVAGKPVPATPAPASTAPVVSTGGSRSVGGVAWHWPVTGTLLKRFQRNDAIPGIEIGGKAGAAVRAAADGVVVYSGNGLVGYGELVIIKHNDSFLSAYGHNRKRLVTEGQHVKAGQQIAEMGSTGASRDELEFQIRKDGNPVDPLDYLPSR
jgi:lipoprotein NlpD